MRQPGVVSVSSRVCDGSVGNTLVEAGFLRIAPQVPFHAVDTLLWNGPGDHPRRCGSVLKGDDLFELLCTLFDKVEAHGHGARTLLTGYLASVDQVKAVARFLDSPQKPDVYFLDPVLGENGKLFVPRETAEAVRELLFPRCNLIMPNLTEALFLLDADKEFPASEDIVDRLRARLVQLNARPTELLVKSLVDPASPGNLYIRGLHYVDGEAIAFRRGSRRVDGRYHGTGDLFSGIFTALYLTEGRDCSYATEIAMDYLSNALTAHKKAGEWSLRAAFLSLPKKRISA